MADVVDAPTRPPPPGGAVRPPRRAGPGALVVVALVAVAAAFLLPSWGVLLPDTKPELYLNPDRMLARELSAWRPVPALGSPNYHPGIAPVTAVVLALQALGLAPWASQRVLALALAVLGGVGAAVLARTLDPRDPGQGWRAPGWFPVVAGIAYAVHPYAVVAGATLPIRLPHAILPWFLAAGLRALREPGWRWTAVTALAYAVMGGINGGIVNLLLALGLPVAAVVVARIDGIPTPTLLRRLLAVTAACVAVSLYWLVPTLLAAGSTGTDVAAATESPAAVAGTSTPLEVLRGLGMWTLYLVVGGQPEVPGHVAYLTGAVPVVASLLLPAVAAMGVAVARPRTRLLAVGLLALAVPLMVGLHASPGPSPLGRALAWAFANVPGAIGFRTTNKAGSLAALAVALLVAAAASGRWSGRRAGPAVVVVVALAAWPLWLGDAQPVRLDVPDHWRAAAAELDTDDPGRLLFLPGGFLARYDWGYEGVDDLDTALFDRREVVWRPTVPAGSRPAHGLLTAFDVALNEGSLSPTATDAHLDLLGVDEVLVRADSRNLVDGAAMAAELLDQVLAVDGAEVVGSWGPPTVQLDDFGRSAPERPALVAVGVGARTPARATPARGALVVAGDGEGIAALADTGLEPSARSLWWLDDLDAGDAVATLGDGAEGGGRLVLTDTNRRRRWDVRGVGRSHSVVLPARAELDPAETRVRDLDPATQTTAIVQGAASVTSSDDEPRLFRVDATTPATFAVDGDPGTSWLTGAFDAARDTWLRIDYPDPVPVDDVVVTVDTQRRRRPTVLEVEVAGARVRVDVERDGVARVSLPGRSPWIEVRVAEVSGQGNGPIGITDVAVGDRFVRWGQRLPRLPDAVLDDPAARAAVADAPTDVVFTRLQGAPDDPFDDEERGLLRDFELVGAHEFAVAATVRPAGPPEHLVEQAVDLRGGLVTSPEATDQGVLGRATQALDDDPTTAWRPLGAAGTLDVSLERPTPLAAVTVRRPRGQDPTLVRLDVASDDGRRRSVEAVLEGPRTVVELPTEVTAEWLSVTVAAPGLEGQVAPVTDIDLPGVRARPLRLDSRLVGCAPLGTMDGALVGVEVDLAVGDVVAGEPVDASGCEPLRLGSGTHRYDAGLGWTVDRLVLRSGPVARLGGRDDVLGTTTDDVAVVRTAARSRTHHRLEVTADEPVVLSTGIAWDPRWSATADGIDLGPPRQVAGHAVGWRLPAGRHEVVVSYGPQRAVDTAFVLSGVAVAVLAVVAIASRRRPS